jgi:hypothetical protein
MVDRDVFVPLSEAAYRFGMSRNRVQRRIESGDIDGVFQDGRWWVRKSELPKRRPFEAEEPAA